MHKLYSILYSLLFLTYMNISNLFIFMKHNYEMFQQNFESVETFHFGSQTEMGSKTILTTMVADQSIIRSVLNH